MVSFSRYLRQWQRTSNTAQVLATFRPGAPLLNVGDEVMFSVIHFKVERIVTSTLAHGQTVLLRPREQAGKVSRGQAAR